MRFRRGQLCLLFLWSILLVLRILTDLIGRLWLLVLTDFSQLLLCIIGIFAAKEQRKNLLIVHLIGCLLIVASNGVLVGWWLQYFGSTDRPILSLGLPFSFSFWIKYTPQCQSVFESATGIEKQSPCWLPFFWIESAICILFIALALLSAILSIINFSSKKKPLPVPIPALTLNKTIHHGHSTASYPKRGLNFTSSHGGYANTVYDDERVRPSSGESVYGVRETRRSTRMEETDLSAGEKRGYAEIRKERGMREGERRGPSQRRFERRREERSTDHRPDSSMVSREEREMKTTSLISFDPKSPTPIQVHEVEESLSDSSSSPSIDDYVVRGPSRSQILRASQRVWNGEEERGYKREEETGGTSQLYGRSLGHTNSSVDSAYCGSGRREWNRGEGEGTSPDFTHEQGLPLSTAPYPGGRESFFQIRPSGPSQAIGHYHSIEELQLVQPGGAKTTISRDALLV